MRFARRVRHEGGKTERLVARQRFAHARGGDIDGPFGPRDFPGGGEKRCPAGQGCLVDAEMARKRRDEPLGLDRKARLDVGAALERCKRRQRERQNQAQKQVGDGTPMQRLRAADLRGRRRRSG
jgi:hypothetical protein